ncbi:type II secretion system F family protein [Devosia sp. XJ19-1]|uniref:Type II secretion system F family protein n=1 Tax=Devosia ureilytica TaxID=2952754 RepID=A0A9Q4AN18_9HYPH|nr:type II secretion system F family protein [Devosia ureilytica]MCP8883586.1 type II secretion system F family protein [Devosia ureilytica]MCP8887194.1 type II secretion system F family protein [Devosia ureilytica]
MATEQLVLYVIYALAAAAAAMMVIALGRLFEDRGAHRAINRRLKRLAADEHPQETLAALLTERGLSVSGDYLMNIVWLNRLYVQSGRTGRPLTYFVTYALVGTGLALALTFLRLPLPVALLVGLVVAIILPLVMLRRARSARIRKFEKQLPDALDMIVRSLRAGHPTSVAVGLVAREMPDPIGTEFGIVFDEVSFGSQLETAIRKLAERVGFEGLQLLSVGVGIQAKTGGNLAEILGNLSATLRERHTLRLKVRSLASEGKMSAIMMSLFPLVMFGILLLIAPSYYGAVWDDPLVMPVFTVFGVWALFGDFIMYRMVNFDF